MSHSFKRVKIPIISIVLLLLLVIVAIVIFQKNNQEGTGQMEQAKYSSDPTYYTEKYRPQFHLSPETGNMSDPNGMVFFEGEYHQFYQNSGQWGHAVSKNLLHWEHLPLAIAKDELGDIWSGSAVVDWQDTSGFFDGEPGLVAIFTHFKNGLQSQSIAYSTDKGRTWTKYEGNPVIPNPKVKDFRDPKVFWHEPTQAWVMVVSVDQKLWFYNSPDLKKWEMTGEFGLGHGSHAAVWECPDLFELPIEGTGEKKWVLTVSIGNNTATKGSKAQYFIGSFDGRTFKNDNKPAVTLWSDYGKDFYAAVSYSDIPEEDGRRIWLGWMSNWRYPFSMPTGTWKGNMSIPRELKLRDIPGEGIRLVQEPIVELEALRGKPEKFEKQTLTAGGSNPMAGIRGTSFETELEFAVESEHVFGIKFRKGSDQETIIRYEPKSKELIFDRLESGKSDFEENFAEQMSAPLQTKAGKIKLRLFVDETTVEVFANDGEAVLTNIMFPDSPSTELELFSEGEVTLNKGVYYPMRSIWRDEDPNGSQPLRILVNQPILHLMKGEKTKLEASVIPLAARQEVKWVSSDNSVVTVKADGDASISATVTGIKEGKAEIKAISEDEAISFSLNVFVE